MKLSMVSLLAVLSLGCAPAALPSGAPTNRQPAPAPVLTSARLSEATPSLDILAQRTSPSHQAAAAELASTAQPAHFRFAHVLHEGGPRIVLAQSAADEWATGAATLVSKAYPVVARRAVNTKTKDLPAELVAAQGRRVTLFKAGSVVCEAKIVGLSILALVEPHFGLRGEWEGAGEEGKTPLTDPEIADEAWELAGTEGRFVVADLEPAPGASCEGATWARDPMAAPEAVARASVPSASLHRRALAAFRALPAYGELQRSYRDSDPQTKGAWEEAADIDLNVSEMKLGAGAGTWVWVSAHTTGGCGDFYAQLSALFELRQGPFGPELVARFASQESPESAPEAALDGGNEADGRVEILFPGARLHAPSASAGYVLEKLHVPSFDCPC